MPHPVTALRALFVATLLLITGKAAAQPVPDAFSWSTDNPEDQLAADSTVIPLGKGAIFVPAIVDPDTAPGAILVDEDEVSDIPVGERVLVDPGPYVVIVSPGTPGQGVGQAIDVVEGETTMVPVKWGALRISVTDEKRVPVRSSYELIRADSREPIGTGFGADTLQGETLMTWLLPPGVYRVVRQGGTYRTLTDWMTVYVPESGFVRYRLVVDPDTGEFRGGGMLLESDFGVLKDRDQRLFTSLVVGGDGSLVQQNNVVGSPNQVLFSGNLFIDGQLAYNADPHRFTFLLQVEEGASQVRPRDAEPLPLAKGIDRIRGDALYTWFLAPSLGPYARGAAETQAFATNVIVTEDTVFVKEFSNDRPDETVFVPANDIFRVAGAWEPTIIREGVGMNARFLNSRWFNLNWRLGLGLRQNLYGGAFNLDDDDSTDTVEYKQLNSFDQQGVESTIVLTAVLPGWAVYSTNVELFGDLGRVEILNGEAVDASYTPVFADRISAEWRNTLSLRVTRNVALNFYANLYFLPQVDDATQLEQSVLLRFSWDIL